MTNVKVIDGRQWRTPLTGQPARTVRTARFKTTHYRGTYRHEGVGGYEYWHTGTWLPVVGLQQKCGRFWQTWMVDDPLHWDGMAEAVADLPAGRILVAGLGLGLMLHHMRRDERFTAVTVVEMSADVVELVRPTLPADDRVTVVVDDFYRFIQREPGVFDGVLWDLAVGGPPETFASFALGQGMVSVFLPGVPLVQFGIRRKPRPEGMP